ncbi:MAG: ABC transporter permease [Bacteroidetes bacterium]|nr:ABC transporter permease [Bacteroidota bacterium]
MNTAIDILWSDLALGFILLVIPFFILWYYKTGLLKPAVISVIRMTVQLLLVGLYLEYIFILNNMWINLAWVLIMVIIATVTTVKRSELNRRLYLIPVFVSLAISLIIVDVYFLGFVIKLDNLFEAIYLIPITGMLLGNCIRINILGLSSYYNKLQKEQILYKYALANGATKKEALFPYMRNSLKTSFAPTIATMAVVGLVSLPGMMTGQILGGSSPTVAIKYQIMLMITIFVSSIMTVVLTIFISNRFIFDSFHNLRTKIIIDG